MKFLGFAVLMCSSVLLGSMPRITGVILSRRGADYPWIVRVHRALEFKLRSARKSVCYRAYSEVPRITGVDHSCTRMHIHDHVTCTGPLSVKLAQDKIACIALSILKPIRKLITNN